MLSVLLLLSFHFSQPNSSLGPTQPILLLSHLISLIFLSIPAHSPEAHHYLLPIYFICSFSLSHPSQTAANPIPRIQRRRPSLFHRLPTQCRSPPLNPTENHEPVCLLLLLPDPFPLLPRSSQHPFTNPTLSSLQPSPLAGNTSTSSPPCCLLRWSTTAEPPIFSAALRQASASFAAARSSP